MFLLLMLPVLSATKPRSSVHVKLETSAQAVNNTPNKNNTKLRVFIFLHKVARDGFFRKGLFVPLNPAFAFTAAHLIKHSGLAKERVTDV